MISFLQCIIFEPICYSEFILVTAITYIFLIYFQKSDKKGDTELIKPVKEVEIKTEENQDGNKTETGCVIS